MLFRFYVSEDGEVLSNKDYPVQAPLLLLVESAPDRPRYCEVHSEFALEHLRVKHKLYRAITVKGPAELFEAKNGIVWPARLEAP